MQPQRDPDHKELHAHTSERARSMARRAGPNCSPRSGRALSPSTGLRSSGFVSSISAALTTTCVHSSLMTVAAVVLVTVLVATFICHDLAAVSTGAVEDPPWTSIPCPGPLSAQTCWMGYAFNSTLGYPGEGPPPCSDFDEGTELWLQELEATTRLIDELPVVQKVRFSYHEEDPNLQSVAHRWGWWRVSGVRPQQLEMLRGGGCQGWHRQCTSSWHQHRASCL